MRSVRWQDVTSADLKKLVGRVERFRAKLQQKAGPGTSWDYTFPDGTKTTYAITKVQTPEELLDLFASLAIAIWSIKDYLSELSATFGTTPEAIEAYVDSDRYLPLCADLANLIKHGKLKKSRSGKWPDSVAPTYVVAHDPKAPITPIKSLQFGAGSVTLDISDPELVEIKFKVRSTSGAELADGLVCLQYGIASWESFIKAHEPAA